MRLVFFTLCSFLSFSLFSQTWNQLIPQGTIEPRANASMVYHPTEHAIYLFGGQTAEGRQNDLWKLDLADNSWSEVMVVGNIPPIRHTQDAVLDEMNNQMLIFSGQGNGLYLSLIHI